MKKISVLAPVAMAILLLAGCTTPAPSASVTPPPPAVPPVNIPSTGPFQSPVYEQEIAWEKCEEFDCATVAVPLNWAEPDGETIELAVMRSRNADNKKKLGTIILNPGGPGGSGVELVPYFVTIAGASLMQHFDVLGFDPRGVGASTPISCGSDADLNDYFLPDFLVESPADLEAAIAVDTAFAANCGSHTGELIGHVDTVSVARDMDVLRALMGDEQLYYFGYSYGTQLGATYAALYPENVGRMVLDGAVDFLRPDREHSLAQAAGFENALSNFLEWCLGRDDCPVGPDVPAAKAQIKQLLVDTAAHPLATGGYTELNANLLFHGIAVTMYDDSTWDFLRMALAEVMDDGIGVLFYTLAGLYLDWNGVTGTWASNSQEAFAAISCLDSSEREPLSWEDILDFRAEAELASPTFGAWFAGGTGCGEWPWVANEYVTDLAAASKAAPILVIGTTGDPATPYAWAESLTEKLGNATLLTLEGEGHTAYGRSNNCIIEQVDAYLVSGELPEVNTRC